MSPRHVVHGLPSSEQFREHADSIIKRVRRGEFTPPPPLTIVACPLEPHWRCGT